MENLNKAIYPTLANYYWPITPRETETPGRHSISAHRRRRPMATALALAPLCLWPDPDRDFAQEGKPLARSPSLFGLPLSLPHLVPSSSFYPRARLAVASPVSPRRPPRNGQASASTATTSPPPPPPAHAVSPPRHYKNPPHRVYSFHTHARVHGRASTRKESGGRPRARAAAASSPPPACLPPSLCHFWWAPSPLRST